LLSLVRNIPKATASMKDNKWEKKKLQGSELFGKNFGVIGLGNIGRIVADRGRGLKMKVLGYDPFISAEAAARLGVELVSLDELLSRADFITLHTPLTNDTRGLIGQSEFAKMKDGVFLVNAARGGIVDEAACVEALNSGKLAGAAFDVFAEEPCPPDHPLVMHPNVVCTPHLGASTEEAQEKVAVEVAEQFVAFAETGEVRNPVNAVPVSGEMRDQLTPWLELSSALGSLLGQLLTRAGDSIDSLAVEIIGEAVAPGATPCTSAALVGLLRCFVDQTVNEVNARILADERGIEVSEVKVAKGRDLSSGVALTARCGDESYTVKGTLYHLGGRVEPAVVRINEFLVEFCPRGPVLVVRNQDRPGVIGAVGNLLGERGINVKGLHVAHDEEKGVALALWSIDSELDEKAMAEVRALPLIGSATIVRL
jgi:D-3-phosphoglycerate dehydrogenase